MGQVNTTTTPYVPSSGTTYAPAGTVIKTPGGTQITPADIDNAMATLERLRALNTSTPLSAPDQAAREELHSLYATLSLVPAEQLTQDAQEFMYGLNQYEGYRSTITGEPLPDMFQVKDLNSEVLKSLFDELNKSPNISYDDMIALYLKFEDELQQSERLLKTSKHQQRMTAIEVQKSKILESGLADAASLRSTAIAGMAAGAAQGAMAAGALKSATSEVGAMREANRITEAPQNYIPSPNGGVTLSAEHQTNLNTQTALMKDHKAISDHRSMQGQSWSGIGQSAGQMAGSTSKTEAAIAQGDEKEASATATASEFESGQAADVSEKAGQRRDRVLQSFADAERMKGEMLRTAADVA